jgi:hypothetical protein
VRRGTTDDYEAVLLQMMGVLVRGGFARATRDYGRLRSCAVTNELRFCGKWFCACDAGLLACCGAGWVRGRFGSAVRWFARAARDY